MREMTPEVVVADDPLTLVTAADLAAIEARARSVPRRRARILLHGSSDETMQQMFIVMTRGQYVPPIWNGNSPKSYLILSGRMALLRFDANGEVVDHSQLSADEPDLPFFARINEPVWHACISVSPHVTFLETILGPFRGTTFAKWAPSPEDRSAPLYFQRLCKSLGLPAA